MFTVWGLTESQEYWATLFQADDLEKREKALLWTCHHDREQKRLFRDLAQIYDPFVGIALPQGAAICLGVLNTCCYERVDELSAELLPLEWIPDPIPISKLLSAGVLTPDAENLLNHCRYLHPLESDHWNCFKAVLGQTNPLLIPSALTLESWRPRRENLEHILETMARQGCTEEEEQEVFVVLRALALTDPKNQEFSEQLALQIRLRVALRA